MSNTLFSASDWSEDRTGTQIGRITLSLCYMGLQIRDVGLYQQGDRYWVTMPSRVTEEKNGRRRYEPLVDFASRAERDEFGELALEAIGELLAEKDGVA